MTIASESSSRGSSRRRGGRLPGVAGAARLGAAVVASGALVLGFVAAAGPAGAAPARVASAVASHRVATTYVFITLGSHKDRTFNQLLGINSSGKIAGYFGSGAKGHPNKGYTVRPPFHQSNFRSENFPGSKQTQVTGLNNHGVTVGFFSTQNKKNLINNNIGFWAHNHHFHPIVFPTTSNSSPVVDQLLGVNDHRRAVGFYVNAAGNPRAYRFNIRTGNFHRVRIPGSTGVVATGINNKGSISGFFIDSGGNTHGFFLRHTGRLFILDAPGATMTDAFGVNKHGEVVGAWTSGSESHGFTWTRQGGFQTVDDPNGIGATVINGIDKQGVLVGFYTNSNGNTKGMIAAPQN
jgi:probable HAF family extracellular repeat protein